MNLPNDDLRAQISTREMFKMQFEASYGLASALTFVDDLKSLLALGENGKKQYPQMSLFTNIYDGAVKLCINKNQTIGYSPSTSTDTALKRECGFIKHLAYSFIPLKYLSRSDDLIESTKDLSEQRLRAVCFHKVKSPASPPMSWAFLPHEPLNFQKPSFRTLPFLRRRILATPLHGRKNQQN